eukprot:217582-Prymnesium_polylepis.1
MLLESAPALWPPPFVVPSPERAVSPPPAVPQATVSAHGESARTRLVCRVPSPHALLSCRPINTHQFNQWAPFSQHPGTWPPSPSPTGPTGPRQPFRLLITNPRTVLRIRQAKILVQRFSTRPTRSRRRLGLGPCRAQPLTSRPSRPFWPRWPSRWCTASRSISASPPSTSAPISA